MRVILTLAFTLTLMPAFCQAANEDLAVEEKLKQIVLPGVEFVDVPFSDCLKYLEKESRKLDPSPFNKGVTIFDETDDADEALITLRLTNVPLSEALRYTCALANRKFVYNDRGIDIKQIEDGPETRMNLDTSTLERKLESITIPKIAFKDTSLSEALGFLHQMSMELDPETDPNKKGINLVLEGGIPSPEPEITLNLTNVSLGEAFNYTASLAGLELQLDPDHVILVSKD